jgi:hypothetical protein
MVDLHSESTKFASAVEVRRDERGAPRMPYAC